MKKVVMLLFCELCVLAMVSPLEAQVISQYPLSPFGGSIDSLAGAVNSYNTYITSGAVITRPLDGTAAALSVTLTQNQKNIDAALAKGVNASFSTVAYNSVTGVPLYVGN